MFILVSPPWVQDCEQCYTCNILFDMGIFAKQIRAITLQRTEDNALLTFQILL